MKRLVVIGGGTAGTIVANKLHRRLGVQWRVTVIDRHDRHYYQPGFLFIPFGPHSPERVVRSRRWQLAAGVELLLGDVDWVDPGRGEVILENGRRIGYDFLVIASGTEPRPDQTPGMLGPQWRRGVHEFYTYDGAVALRDALAAFDHGRLVVHVVDMPIKCPVAPLEWAFLADDALRRRGVRDRVELVYATPLSEAFTKPVAAAHLGGMLDERKIQLEPDFVVERIDPQQKTLISYDEREIPFDLLVTVPLNMGAEYVARSGLGDELNYVPVDRHTLRSTAHPNIFAIGDASNIPTSKAGSAAHFAAEVFTENFVDLAAGRPMNARFDGHANCFVESGDGKALLIDFDYDTEPLPGRYPFPGVGPFRLLAESAANHWGKLAFGWLYWNVLLPGRPIPLPARKSRAGAGQPNP